MAITIAITGGDTTTYAVLILAAKSFNSECDRECLPSGQHNGEVERLIYIEPYWWLTSRSPLDSEMKTHAGGGRRMFAGFYEVATWGRIEAPVEIFGADMG